jgi:transposase
MVFMPAPYPIEFRREAVELLRRSGKTVPQLAAELGVSPQSLRNGSRQIDVDEGKAEGVTSDEREELRGLRRELRTVTEEREIIHCCSTSYRVSRPCSGPQTLAADRARLVSRACADATPRSLQAARGSARRCLAW